MNDDADHHESEVPEMLETQQETQEETQSTQPASQREGTMDAHLWGYLQPCNAALTRMDFWKIRPKYTIGRNHDGNEIILPGFKISNYHCVIMWDGKEDRTSCVTVQDLSSNGTFINGTKIGRGNTKILREGSELAFGTCTPQIVNGGIEDYRFVYRHLAAGPPTEGLYKYYDLCNELGKGSFATVMKAVHLATGEWVAIKMIQDKKANAAGTNANADGNGTTRHQAFMREISIMEQLKHPNICELKEVYMQPNGDINLVLELVEGGDLLDYILTRHGLAEDDAKHITYQICDALAYIHSLGVAHRDLKPENILLTSDTPPRVKVADFGLAKVVDSLTMLRTMCGTPSYLAPEVVKQQNAEGYDNLVDSWSVGVIVFSMLTNAGPFIEDENQRDIRMRIIERQIDWDTLYNSNVSQEAQSFIRSLLVDNPTRRMTLTDALHHPWLQSYTPVYTPSSYLQQHSSTGSSIPSDDFSMLSDIPEGNEPGSSHNVVDIKREGSRSQPLQRRARVLEDAAEGKGEILQPSQEMINAVLLLEPGNAAQKIDRKRALDEDAEMESVAEEDVVNSRKKGKGVFDDVASPRAKGRGRGKANGGISKVKAGTGRTKVSGPAIADVSEDDGSPATRLRRSSRHSQPTPQKLPRFN
ncbi:kinase-like protein [Pleurotus eryngii]|uniref:Kinase-like protein n=1 Tax=Pleurotus eryngii TaxID=5323 RepID=A0A9P6A321_PLEER|nr:kinase-like protein [Pleurotus eryngii]